MVTLLASLVGFIGSIIPEVIKIFKLKKEQDYQLSVLDKQIELRKAESSTNENSFININEIKTAFDQDERQRSKNNFVDSINSMVRPSVAYGFFIIYILIKYAQYLNLHENGIMSYSSEVLWTEDDKAAFASIISFYFGQRMFKNKR